jgi:hypothetical protein
VRQAATRRGGASTGPAGRAPASDGRFLRRRRGFVQRPCAQPGPDCVKPRQPESPSSLRQRGLRSTQTETCREIDSGR